MRKSFPKFRKGSTKYQINPSNFANDVALMCHCSKCSTSSGKRELSASSSGCTLVNSLYTICFPFVNGSKGAIFFNPFVNKRPFAPVVHLHSPRRMVEWSRDSATTSSSISLLSGLPSSPITLIFPHQRRAMP